MGAPLQSGHPQPGPSSFEVDAHAGGSEVPWEGTLPGGHIQPSLSLQTKQAPRERDADEHTGSE